MFSLPFTTETWSTLVPPMIIDHKETRQFSQYPTAMLDVTCGTRRRPVIPSSVILWAVFREREMPPISPLRPSAFALRCRWPNLTAQCLFWHTRWCLSSRICYRVVLDVYMSVIVHSSIMGHEMFVTDFLNYPSTQRAWCHGLRPLAGQEWGPARSRRPVLQSWCRLHLHVHLSAPRRDAGRVHPPAC